MTAYRQVYDSRHLQDDCQEPGSAPKPYARQSSTGYLYLFTDYCYCKRLNLVSHQMDMSWIDPLHGYWFHVENWSME